jgi:hypothetical protein
LRRGFAEQHRAEEHKSEDDVPHEPIQRG